MKALVPGLLLGVAAVLAACSGADAPVPVESTPLPPPPVVAPPPTADVDMRGASGSSVSGTLNLAAANGGVSVQGELRGLQPGSTHAFHFHENGDCSAPDASSAGEHFNPHGAQHGGPDSPTRHLGDLPNITSDSQGIARVQAVVNGATLRDGGTGDLAGRAAVLHAQADDYVTQPSGDSGDRIACGVVR